MGAAAGHLQYIWENGQLTFADIKNVFDICKNDSVLYEKFDGLNLMFKYDSNGLRLARNITQIKNGGLSIDELAVFLKDKGNVQRALIEASEVLQKYLSTQENQFPNSYWFSIEVLHKCNTNVIEYDCENNVIVFHDSPCYELIDGELVVQLVQVQYTNVQVDDWLLLSPQQLPGVCVSDDYYDQIDSFVAKYNLTLDSTIQQYEIKCLTEIAKQHLSFDEMMIRRIVGRAVNITDAFNLSVLKRQLTKEQCELLASFMKLVPTIRKEIIAPLESILYSFANEVIRQQKSCLVHDEIKIRTIIMNRIHNDLQALQHNDYVTKKYELITELHAMEGVVFHYNDETYKLTGTFAPINHLLGIRRYNRVQQKQQATVFDELQKKSLDSFDEFVKNENKKTKQALLLKKNATKYHPALSDYSWESKQSVSQSKYLDSRQLLKITDITPLKWNKWPLEVIESGLEYGSNDVSGLGAGENWLAYVFGAHIMGKNSTFDLTMPDGTLWEVKQITKQSKTVRPGTLGTKMFTESFDSLKDVIRQIQAFSSQIDYEQLDNENYKRCKFISGFIADEYGKIVEQGEISYNRFVCISSALHVMHDLAESFSQQCEKHKISISDIETTINTTELIRFANLFCIESLKDKLKETNKNLHALSCITSDAFKDPDSFLKDWFANITPSKAFPDIHGIILVNQNGFMTIPIENIDTAMTFSHVTLGKPKFEVTKDLLGF
jgi:hypothetical protein